MDDELKITDYLIIGLLIMFWPIVFCELMSETLDFNRRCEERSIYWKR